MPSDLPYQTKKMCGRAYAESRPGKATTLHCRAIITGVGVH